MTKEERLQKYLQENPEVQLHKVRKKRVKQTAEEKRIKHMLYARIWKKRNLQKVKAYNRDWMRKNRLKKGYEHYLKKDKERGGIIKDYKYYLNKAKVNK